MLGQIANYCPVISRNTIVKNSTSMSSIWQAIRLHFGFQSTGVRLLNFNNITLAPAERPEDLYQRLMSFIEDNLLLANGKYLTPWRSSQHRRGTVSHSRKSCSTNMVEISPPWPPQFWLSNATEPSSGPSLLHLSNLKFLKHWIPSWKRSITMSMLKSCVPRHRSSDSLRGAPYNRSQKA